MRSAWFETSDAIALKNCVGNNQNTYKDVYDIAEKISIVFNPDDIILLIGKLSIRLLTVWWSCWIAGSTVMIIENFYDKMFENNLSYTKIISIDKNELNKSKYLNDIRLQTYRELVEHSVRLRLCQSKSSSSSNIDLKDRNFCIAIRDKESNTVRVLSEYFLKIYFNLT